MGGVAELPVDVAVEGFAEEFEFLGGELELEGRGCRRRHGAALMMGQPRYANHPGRFAPRGDVRLRASGVGDKAPAFASADRFDSLERNVAGRAKPVFVPLVRRSRGPRRRHMRRILRVRYLEFVQGIVDGNGRGGGGPWRRRRGPRGYACLFLVGGFVLVAAVGCAGRKDRASAPAELAAAHAGTQRVQDPPPASIESPAPKETRIEADAENKPAEAVVVAPPVSQTREESLITVRFDGREFVERYPAAPYVKDGREVLILPGETLSLRAEVGSDGKLTGLVVASRAEGDVHLKLEHHDDPGQPPRTTLRVQHDFDRPLRYCAAMRLFGGKREAPTSTIGVRPGVPSIEMWPDTIAHLRLFDFELMDERRGCE